MFATSELIPSPLLYIICLGFFIFFIQNPLWQAVKCFSKVKDVLVKFFSFHQSFFIVEGNTANINRANVKLEIDTTSDYFRAITFKQCHQRHLLTLLDSSKIYKSGNTKQNNFGTIETYITDTTHIHTDECLAMQTFAC